MVEGTASSVVRPYRHLSAEKRYVNYPGLPDHSYEAVALKQFRKDHFGGVLSFGVKGGAEQGEKVVDSLLLASNLANVGEAKTASLGV
jgi:O-acetylhomoserine/O-acetylserine sulfhydrylase